MEKLHMKIFSDQWQTPDGQILYTCVWQPVIAPRAIILLVHGLGEYCRRYDHVCQAFTDAGFIVYGFDHRGHGKSSGARGHIPSMEIALQDIRRFVQTLPKEHPDLPCFVYGHSMGGLMVLDYGFKYPQGVKGIISTSPGIRPTIPIPGAKLVFGRMMKAFYPQFSLNNGLPIDGLTRTVEVVKAYQNDPLTHDRISAALAVDMIDAGKWMLTQNGSYPLPLLLFHGSADRLTDPAASQQFASQMQGDITMRVWEGGYHELHNDPFREEVIGAIIEWIIHQSTQK